MPDDAEVADDEVMESLEEAGISQEGYEKSPEYGRERFAKLARQKIKARERAETAEAQLAATQARLAVLESNMASPREQAPASKKTGLDQFETPEQLRDVARQLYEFQQIAVDPDLTPEQRAAARKELAAVKDVPGTIMEIQDRIARMRAEEILGKDRAERSQKEKVTTKNSDLARRLVVKYGQDALDKDSALSKKAVSLIQDWMADGVVSEDSDNLFVTIQAFKEAHAAVSKNRGGRGSDPRHSAVEGNGQADRPPTSSAIAALEKRASEGDRAAGRKASSLKLGAFLKNLRDSGQINS